MIPIGEINAMSTRLNVPIDTVEKDYIISWILLCLSRSKLSQNFTFYGGTAIKRMYFEDHRFSEDIDLISEKSYSKERILSEMSALSYAKEMANISLAVNPDTITVSKGRIQLYITYTGFDEIIGPPKSVTVDLVMGRESFGDIEDKRIIKSYSDIQMKGSALSVMTLNTILANKLGLLNDITRNEPRDLFDVWFLLNRKDQFDFNFERVRAISKEKYSVYPSLSIISNSLTTSSFEKNWEIRLSKQISGLPTFNLIVKDINSMLADLC